MGSIRLMREREGKEHMWVGQLRCGNVSDIQPSN